MSHPFGMLAEVTYRCPLHCPYCSNPTAMSGYREELETGEWQRVMHQARALGVWQVHLSGGEPLGRSDLEELVATASRLGLYTNLITSGVGLTEGRAEALLRAGLEHVQISFQGADPATTQLISGTRSFPRKIAAAAIVKKYGWPLSVNVVLHRHNLAQVGELIDLADRLGADRLELANTQYYGWAARNRAALLPSRMQLDRADEVVRAARARLAGRMEIIYVLPDYYGTYPKPCMDGWARRQLTVAPNGDVLPCPAAQTLPLPRANVREHDLSWIWNESPLFQRFRGTAWMPEPCRSCSRREIDLGGCRCQAFLLTGDASRTDPACRLSPDHAIVADAVRDANARDTADARSGLMPRTNPPPIRRGGRP